MWTCFQGNYYSSSALCNTNTTSHSKDIPMASIPQNETTVFRHGTCKFLIIFRRPETQLLLIPFVVHRLIGIHNDLVIVVEIKLLFSQGVNK